MDRSRIFKLALLAGAAVSLQGCVAAIAPIAAASGVLGSSTVRGGSDDAVAAAAAPAPAPSPAPAAAPAPEPRVIVERSDQRMAASDGQDDAPMPASAETSSLAAAANADPVVVGSAEQTATFASGASVSNTAPAPSQSATQLALRLPAEPEPEPAPATLPAAEPAITNAPPRIIAVDPQVALADRNRASASVSAAQAAAALTNLPANAEAEPATVDLARSPQVAARQGAGVSATAQVTTTATATAAANAAANAAAAPAAATAASASAAMAEVAPASPAALPPARTAQASPPAAKAAEARPLATGTFASLVNYATRQQSLGAGKRASAVLADRASLTPRRAACSGEPTVLIDLDPQGDPLDPTNVSRAAPGLASALAQLRTAGVKIAWISRNAQGQVRPIRAALNRSGLDIEDADEVLLMRYPEDRKQTRREDLAASSCLIAIAGDMRTDFDELFEYLINPEVAATFDPLMDSGWFLIPSPFDTERPSE